MLWENGLIKDVFRQMAAFCSLEFSLQSFQPVRLHPKHQGSYRY